jgi:hypothetical protein
MAGACYRNGRRWQGQFAARKFCDLRLVIVAQLSSRVTERFVRRVRLDLRELFSQ